MEEQLPYYEDRQQEAWEDYNNLVAERDQLRARNAELEAEVAALESELAIAKAGIEAMSERLQAHQTRGNTTESRREDR